ncbi:MAG: alpha/beta fold hydrolase [Proteobacteria bacterium]|nr:alpha/beta fold hydrolase [Pseudomonadota bacterium]
MRLQVNGVTLNYEVFGDSGPWVVLSHSLMCDLKMWGAQIDALKSHYRVLAFDTRGHGGSEAPEGAYTLDQLAIDAKALLDRLDIKNPHWIGLSMGGMIGMTYAIKFPNSFASLVLCDTTSRMPLEAQPALRERIAIAKKEGMKALVSGTMERWFTDSFLSQPRPEIEFVASLIEKTPVAGYVGCCHAISQINCTERLAEIKVPIKIIVGDSDVGTPVSMSKEIQAAAPGSSLTVIEGASHLSNLEQPQQFNKALLDFLKEHSMR